MTSDPADPARTRAKPAAGATTPAPGPAVGRVAGLAATASVVSLVATIVWLRGWGQLHHFHGVNVWSLGIAFAIAEALPAHFEHRREAVSISLTTVPLVVGLV